MSHKDFPLIVYPRDKSPYERGCIHGEQYRDGIGQLAAIRRELMLSKNPRLKKSLKELSLKQMEISRLYDEGLCEELRGIAEGAGASVEDITILNNYTDFRDIQLPEEGCSSVHVQRGGTVVSGQTWDMHSSAKDYVSLIVVPGQEDRPGGIFFSLVGCVGMMGVNSSRCLLGVNNLNTKNATAAVIWPVVVRRALQEDSLSAMEAVVKNSPLTSGHNYMLSDARSGLHMEACPDTKDVVLRTAPSEEGAIFHTNHCLNPKLQSMEIPLAVNSTSQARYRLIEAKLPHVSGFQELLALLRDHENHPKSICSHFESGLQDPSMTCGGGAADLTGEKIVFWRGCAEFDENFKEYAFTFGEGDFGRPL